MFLNYHVIEMLVKYEQNIYRTGKIGQKNTIS